MFATLVRLLGELDLAEEALHEAFAAAVEQWTRDGIPQNPRAWLVTVGRLRGIDALRRRRRAEQATRTLGVAAVPAWPPQPAPEIEDVVDDRLRPGAASLREGTSTSHCGFPQKLADQSPGSRRFAEARSSWAAHWLRFPPLNGAALRRAVGMTEV